MIDAIMQRLLAHAAGLRSVQGALDLTRLLQSKGLPGEGPAAFVVPVGLRGGAVQDATGLFVQNTDETIGVVVVFRNVEAGARGAADPVKPVIDAVIAALAGWGPEGAQDVFRLLRGAVVNFAPGSLVYQIDFAIGDQLRITP